MQESQILRRRMPEETLERTQTSLYEYEIDRETTKLKLDFFQFQDKKRTDRRNEMDTNSQKVILTADTVEIILGEIGIIVDDDAIVQITNSTTSNSSELIRIPWRKITKMSKNFFDLDPEVLKRRKAKQSANYGIRISGGTNHYMDISLGQYSLENAETVYKYLLDRTTNKHKPQSK